MKYKALIASCALVLCAVAILPASAETARNVFKTVFAHAIVLKGKGAYIQKKGSAPVTIKDNLKVKGNINLAAGATVDGKDISELVTLPECSPDSTIIQTVDGWVCDDSGDAGLPDCDENSTLVDVGDGWACDNSGDAIGVAYDAFVTVAKTGGDFTTITEALASITDASAGRHYVVWIAPGLYSESVTLPEYVDLQGASRDSVTIYPNDLATDAAAITSGGHNVVRDVTISSGGSGNMTEVYVQPGHTFELDNVVAYVSEIAGTEAKTVYNDQGYLTVRRSDLSAGSSAGQSYGIYSTGSLVLDDSTIRLSDYSSHTDIYGVYIGATGFNSTIKNTSVELSGGGDGDSTGADECYGVYLSAEGMTVTVENTDVNVERCNVIRRAVYVQSTGTTTVKAYDSRFTTSGVDYAISVDQSTFSAASIMASGTGVENSGGLTTCLHSYTDDFIYLNATCGVD